MSDDVARSIRFPLELWQAIDEDAKRCKRSSVKQMEAVLTAYYGLEDVDLNRMKLEIIGEIKRLRVLRGAHDALRTVEAAQRSSSLGRRVTLAELA